MNFLEKIISTSLKRWGISLKITIFTSNQARHVALIKELSNIADTIYAVQECTTVFPGRIEDFYKKSDTMQKYFAQVMAAEQEVFGNLSFPGVNVRQLAIKMGDLNMMDLSELSEALNSDYYIIFGSSYIKGPLIDYLIERKAINIHMGVSPYYRGSSCNFWALYDNHPELVGATVHRLSKGLDSGDMLFHALPSSLSAYKQFTIGMSAVQSAQKGLAKYLETGQIETFTPVKQEKRFEIRYSRYIDFNDAVAEEYLNREYDPIVTKQKMDNRELSQFLNPFIL